MILLFSQVSSGIVFVDINETCYLPITNGSVSAKNVVLMLYQKLMYCPLEFLALESQTAEVVKFQLWYFVVSLLSLEWKSFEYTLWSLSSASLNFIINLNLKSEVEVKVTVVS